jgi:hypothetical protein
LDDFPDDHAMKEKTHLLVLKKVCVTIGDGGNPSPSGEAKIGEM